jgi:nucleoid-associated protein YgaU
LITTTLDPSQNSGTGTQAGQRLASPPTSVTPLGGSEKKDAGTAAAPSAPEGSRTGGVEKITSPLRGNAGSALLAQKPGAQAEGKPTADPSTGSAPGQFPQSYVIREDDNYWRIAEKFYGKGSLFTHLEKANPGVKMQPGKQLVIPPPPGQGAALQKSGTVTAPGAGTASAANTGLGSKGGETPSSSGLPTKGGSVASGSGGYRTYQVEKGDTFWSLAKKFYGDSKKYTRLEEANPEQKNGLVAGAKIKIPE